MENSSFGTVSALQFQARPELNFVDIVEEFDIAFQMADSPTRGLKWDCDDVAILDRDLLRIALGWVEPSDEDQPWYLIIGVGPSPDMQGNPADLGYFIGHQICASFFARQSDPREAVHRMLSIRR